jgi:hypothetical protein
MDKEYGYGFARFAMFRFSLRAMPCWMGRRHDLFYEAAGPTAAILLRIPTADCLASPSNKKLGSSVLEEELGRPMPHSRGPCLCAASAVSVG